MVPARRRLVIAGIGAVSLAARLRLLRIEHGYSRLSETEEVNPADWLSCPVGKTIEAGLILKELRARTDIASILVICPKALVAERKWQSKMKRFDEHFTPLDGPLLRHCLKETNLEGEWPEQYAKAILSLFDSDLVLYLTPLLVMREPAGSLLAQTNRLVVARQQAYARSLGIPWAFR